MRINQNFKRLRLIIRCWIAGLVILTSAQCFADSKPNQDQPHNSNKEEFLEQAHNGYLSFRLENAGELLQALSSFRRGEKEQALDYAFLISLYAYQESNEVLIFTENNLPNAIESTEQQGIAFEFFEYSLDIAVWDLWERYNLLEKEEKKLIMATLNAVKDYRQIYPRKKESELAIELKTIFPGELDSGIDYTSQAEQILSRLLLDKLLE